MAIGIRLRMYILTRDEFRCVYCGAAPARWYLHVDHVVPRAAGGPTHPANLVTSCQDCNLRKSDNPVVLPLPVLARLAAESRFDWSILRGSL